MGQGLAPENHPQGHHTHRRENKPEGYQYSRHDESFETGSRSKAKTV
jgi:hypothetical protein